MDAIRRMGISYGRLGLGTSAEIVEARALGIKSSSDELQTSHIPDLVRTALGLKVSNSISDFIEHFRKNDPTLDLHPGDKELSLLASTALAYELEAETDLSGTIALVVLTASLGGIRPPLYDDALLLEADKTLAEMQSKITTTPDDRTYKKTPASLEKSIESLEQYVGHNNAAATTPHIASALKILSEYAEETALIAARNDNVVLSYIRKLEDEVRIHWWVVGGWCADLRAPFGTLRPADAAVRAGAELSEKHSEVLGLFSAQALLDIVIERGRACQSEKISVSAAAILPDQDWRARTFGTSSLGQLSDLLPVTTAMGLAASSEDAPDWIPRFSRLTGIDSAQEISPVNLGLQVYRECLTLRALAV